MNCEWCGSQSYPDDQGRYFGLELGSEELEERLGAWKGPTIPTALVLAGKVVTARIVREGLEVKLFLVACSGDCGNALEEAVWDDLNHPGSTNET